MKIKIFKSFDFVKLEKNVNTFINDVKVVNTQLSILPAANEHYTQYVLLVMYED
jgi:hypothetical protein